MTTSYMGEDCQENEERPIEVCGLPCLKTETWGTQVLWLARCGAPASWIYRVAVHPSPLPRRRQRIGGFAHLGGALQLFPVERLAVDGALQRFEQIGRASCRERV